ncbi:hypothetical protein BD289DRAFT_478110 [Coniella lustricola]|uniref:Uncharacterized protein n=1 Tax=Coniella lustricola TaxID=2025994 RepID=A0A2T3ANL6_9PEZI|nr:hypothetical protein BD289DRAFT_478110 [Coniella lustricola]
MPSEGLIPMVQRRIREGIGAAGDTTGNFVNSNGKAVQGAARAAGSRVDALGRSISNSGKSANKSTNTYARSLGKQIESYADAAGRSVGAAGRYVDGSGRAAGGRVGDLGNNVKDRSGARGQRMLTPSNPLGLRGKRAV